MGFLQALAPPHAAHVAAIFANATRQSH